MAACVVKIGTTVSPPARMKDTRSAENKHKNERLEVQFSPITEPDGFTFQALVDLTYSSKEN